MPMGAGPPESPAERVCRCAELAAAASEWSAPHLIDVSVSAEADDSPVRVSPLREIGLGGSAFREAGLGSGPAVPASSANLDYRAALHVNAGIRQLSLQEFLD